MAGREPVVLYLSLSIFSFLPIRELNVFVGKADLESKCQQLQDPLACLVAERCEVADPGLIGCQRGRNRLLGLSVFEFTEIHCSVEKYHYQFNGVSSFEMWARAHNLLFEVSRL